VKPIRVTTETDIPIVFHVEFAGVPEVRAAVEVDEGVAVGFQEVASDDMGCTDDKDIEVPDGVDGTAAGSIDEDEVWVREDEDVKVGEATEEEEALLVVGLAFGGNKTSPRSGRRALVVVVES
jgi:hypothetical protein